MSLNDRTREHLAELIHDLRPEWDLPGIHAHLEPLAADQRNAHVIVHDALIRAGKASDTPAMLARAYRGCPLAEAERPVRHGTRCHLHPSEVAADCRPCREERRGPTTQAPPPDAIRARIKAIQAAITEAEDRLGRRLTYEERAELAQNTPNPALRGDLTASQRPQAPTEGAAPEGPTEAATAAKEPA